MLVLSECKPPIGCIKMSRSGLYHLNEIHHFLSIILQKLYEGKHISFLLDEFDTVSAYEERGKIKHAGSSQYQMGMDALTSLNRVQQVEVLHGQCYINALIYVFNTVIYKLMKFLHWVINNLFDFALHRRNVWSTVYSLLTEISTGDLGGIQGRGVNSIIHKQNVRYIYSCYSRTTVWVINGGLQPVNICGKISVNTHHHDICIQINLWERLSLFHCVINPPTDRPFEIIKKIPLSKMPIGFVHTWWYHLNSVGSKPYYHSNPFKWF